MTIRKIMEEESTLESLRLISPGTPQDWMLGSADEENKFWATTPAGTYKVAPWKATSGSQAMALLFNRGTLDPSIATAMNCVYGSTATAVADIAALAMENQSRTISPKKQSRQVRERLKMYSPLMWSVSWHKDWSRRMPL